LLPPPYVFTCTQWVLQEDGVGLTVWLMYIISDICGMGVRNAGVWALSYHNDTWASL